MMRHISMVLLILLFSSGVSAQEKKRYFLFVTTAKRLVTGCTEGQIIKKEEIELFSSEFDSYTQGLKEELKNTYKWADGYNACPITTVPVRMVIIWYKSTARSGSSNCYSTAFSCVTANSFPEAEKRFDDIKKSYKDVTYEELGRWGNNNLGTPTPQTSDGKSVEYGDDKNLIINYKANKTTVVLQIKNKNTDVKAIVEITDKRGRVLRIITINPGATVVESIKEESSFDVTIRYEPGKTTAPGTMQKLKKLIKDQISTDGKGAIKTASSGIRG